MKMLIQLVKRNLLLYLRDKASVFFSFLSVIIIIAMYILFLGNMQINDLTRSVGDIPGLNWLTSSWIMAGILTVSTITVPLASLGTLIKDKENGKIVDFYTSPINRNILALSYLISSWITSFIMVFLNFIIGQIYVILNGGEFFNIIKTLQLVSLFSISIISFSSMFFYISLFMKSQNAFGLLSTIVGTFVGFLGGIYIPIGVLSSSIQRVMNSLPTSHSVTLIRRTYMSGAINKVFKNAPEDIYDNYADIYGLTIKINDTDISDTIMLLYLIVFALFFYILSIIKLKNTKLI
ncbi:hypothetical protein EW093_00165 [Thiospirochaeta perfilievii]|uniref:ABC-2 type transporter transmembrane domain-containing protein n=1 Tax=Thiospirochaeta perfilievii TaxID=252967 RepID=A0A5C1Q811_9SPIO|nr:ABC transporter permease [Thiospirochaeta perfilievii]QEN03180.1 hypothetical protein EW093_00165 [Thiospirochaeta perfilievii]